MSSTDDEQLADFKDWWQRNGKPLVTGGLLALVVVFGWQAWTKYQANQSQGASIVYQQLLETALTPSGQADIGRVAEVAGKQMKRTLLELGGKGAAIVFDDADLKNVISNVSSTWTLPPWATNTPKTQPKVMR